MYLLETLLLHLDVGNQNQLKSFQGGLHLQEIGRLGNIKYDTTVHRFKTPYFLTVQNEKHFRQKTSE